MPKKLHHALNDRRIRALSEPGRYADGEGLHLVVSESGAKRWMQRITIRGRRRDVGLGGYPLVSLADARMEALSLRAKARRGEDPLEARRLEKRPTPTFEDASRQQCEALKPTWKNAKHADQWIRTLETYAFPVIGDRPVDRIETADVLQVLAPIWTEKAETARRVRQRIGTVMDWARAAGFHDKENPGRGVDRGLPKQRDRVQHHAAMPWQDVPGFVASISNDSAPAAEIALRFLILTATRTNEVLGACWAEIDLSEATWTIPAARMKMAQEHRVPLSGPALDTLQQARNIRLDEEYVFPGQRRWKPLSNMSMSMVLRRRDIPYTVHGFRSSFRDWASEKGNQPREIAEMCLAHQVGSKSERAYARSDLIEKRRVLMERWGAHVTQASATVVAIR